MVTGEELRLNELKVDYSDELTDYNKAIGILVPTVSPDSLFKDFLAGLPSMTDLTEVSTIIFNFQKYSDSQINEAVELCHRYGFKVIYSINSYNTDPHVPLNLIIEDTARILPDALTYIRVDDDLKVLGKSPKIEKTGGRQYLELAHYLLSHPSCGVIRSSGTLVRIPPKYSIGPNPVTHIDTYMSTALGMAIRNKTQFMTQSDLGIMLPLDSLDIYGALDDMFAASYITMLGFYKAKCGFVRAKHTGATSLLKDGKGEDTSRFNWTDPILLDNGVAKYIKERWNPKYDWRMTNQYTVTKELYLKNGGVPIWEKEIARQLTVEYPPEKDVKEVIGLVKLESERIRKMSIEEREAERKELVKRYVKALGTSQ